MKLISLNCSGESLEKTIALFHTSYKTNKKFYDSFDKIILFYTENLPKKNTKLVGMSGTFSSLKTIQNTTDVLNSLYQNNFISQRIKDKLKENHERLNDVLINIPIEKNLP